jgi:hypothetical protein
MRGITPLSPTHTPVWSVFTVYGICLVMPLLCCVCVCVYIYIHIYLFITNLIPSAKNTRHISVTANQSVDV